MGLRVRGFAGPGFWLAGLGMGVWGFGFGALWGLGLCGVWGLVFRLGSRWIARLKL